MNINANTATNKLVASLTTSLQNAAQSLSALSEQMSIRTDTKKKIPSTRRARRGRRVGSTKLGADREAQIIDLLQRPGVPIPVAAIAKAFGVSRPTVYNIRDRNKLEVRKRDSRATNRVVEELRAELKTENRAEQPHAAVG